MTGNSQELLSASAYGNLEVANAFLKKKTGLGIFRSLFRDFVNNKQLKSN
jgi:hypothetical protein